MVIYEAVEEPDDAGITALIEFTKWSRDFERIEELVNRVRRSGRNRQWNAAAVAIPAISDSRK
jgi:hypothetical protein